MATVKTARTIAGDPQSHRAYLPATVPGENGGAATFGILVVGPAGIGKSTVLAALAGDQATAEAQRRVLRAAAAEVESGLPYLTLVDLFGAALVEHGSLLPGHLRAALDAALLRTAVSLRPGVRRTSSAMGPFRKKATSTSPRLSAAARVVSSGTLLNTTRLTLGTLRQ